MGQLAAAAGTLHKDTNASRDVMSNLQLMTFEAHSKLHAVQRHKEGKLGPQSRTQAKVLFTLAGQVRDVLVCTK